MKKIATQNLKDIPHSKGMPFVGDFFKILKGTEYFKSQKEKYGDIFSFSIPIGTCVAFLNEKHQKYILKDAGNKISAQGALEKFIGKIYPGCLLLMEGKKHKKHRSILQEAFNKDSLQDYMNVMPDVIQTAIEKLKNEEKQPIQAHPCFQLLTLQIAAKIFYGIESPIEIQKLLDAINPMTKSQYSLQLNIPGTTWNKALKGRKYLESYFATLLPKRRKNPGNDLLSKLCHAQNEDGDYLTDEEVINHSIFMVQASHEATAWSITYMAYQLAKHPLWQEKIRLETKHINFSNKIEFKDLIKLKNTDLVFKESMRLSPPGGNFLRKAEEEIIVNGKIIPKGSLLWININLPLTDKKNWSNPHQFDPERFNNIRKEHKGCPHAYKPFGNSVHFCIGNIFAEINVKMTIIEILKHFSLSVPSNYKMKLQELPLSYPKDGMPIFFEALKN